MPEILGCSKWKWLWCGSGSTFGVEKELVFLLESTFKCFVLWVGCEIVVLLSMVPHFLSMWKCRSIFWDLNVLFNLLFWTIGRKNAVDGKFVFYGYPETIVLHHWKNPPELESGFRFTWLPTFAFRKFSCSSNFRGNRHWSVLGWICICFLR